MNAGSLYKSGIRVGAVGGGEVHALRWDDRAVCGIVTPPVYDAQLTRDHISCNRCRRSLGMPRWVHA